MLKFKTIGKSVGCKWRDRDVEIELIDILIEYKKLGDSAD